MSSRRTLVSFTFLSLFAVPALAQGNGPGATHEDFPGGESSTAEFEKGFGSAGGLSDGEKLGAEEDKLKIGGNFAADFYVFGTDGSGARDYFLNPNTLWVYLDARLRNDIRMFAKERLVFESTGATAGAALPANSSDLEELKLFFNAKKKVFFTLGKQQIKWGAAKFWNPTDVLNNVRRDFLYADDRRSGVTLLKSHVPVGAANLYLVQSFDGATRLREVGQTLRLEQPWNEGELSLTVSKQTGKHAVYGADVSAGLGAFDLYGEVAYSYGANLAHYTAAGPEDRSQKHTTSFVAGVSREFGYGDGDLWGVTLEYFRNADGYAKADYLYPLAAGSFTPFYFSQRYAMLMLYFPTLGSWNETTLSLFNVYNVTDRSALSKVNVSFRVLQDITWDVGASLHYGASDGELRLGNQRYDVSTRLGVAF